LILRNFLIPHIFGAIEISFQGDVIIKQFKVAVFPYRPSSAYYRVFQKAKDLDRWVSVGSSAPKLHFVDRDNFYLKFGKLEDKDDPLEIYLSFFDESLRLL